ncbi:MAG: glycosyltransferase [Candidatus Shapirobacteria bacterium]|nr:glycosyltransferase [Candidatus Shapirobacteria bacterium]
MKNPFFSIIIPVRTETEYLKETLTKLKKQSFKSFEILIITDKISGPVSPAIKRNLGAKKAKGEYLAFLDDDSYPSKDWLKHASKLFKTDIAALCGPCLTPPADNIFQKASGLVWSSYLGSGGAGTYRNSVKSKRFVDDFPSVNLIVKKSDFDKVNGFDTHHWPGEDTILCSNLVYKLNKKILYHPKVIVYHHRRNVVVPHLQQITRYALHRGNFARIYPKTSFRLGYLLPSFFSLYLISLIFFHPIYYLLPLFLYLFLLLLTFTTYLLNYSSIQLSFLATITIPATHIYYGILFIIGFFSKKLDFVPHQTNDKGYIGG